jgi:hypothetical protein
MEPVLIKYTNIFHCKTLQNLPKVGFLFENKSSGNPERNNTRTYVESGTESYI